MITTKHSTVDWLSYTIQKPIGSGASVSSRDDAIALANNVTGVGATWLPAKPHHGYRQALTAKEHPGLTVFYDGSVENMGVHVQWPGQALKTVDYQGRVRYALYTGGRVTRIDLAVDIPTAFDFRGFFDCARAGGLDTRARKASIIDSDSGTTVYIGSRTSEQYLRIYDKAAEARLEGDLTRIELEAKGSTANGIAHYLASAGFDNMPAIIRAFCDWPSNPRWVEIWSGIQAIGIPHEQRQRDTERWLLKTVIPAIKRLPEHSEETVKRVAITALLHLDKVSALQAIREIMPELV